MLGITVVWNILYIWNLLLCLLKESATLFVEKTGHMNDNFHKPNGDPSGHKLYKGPNQPTYDVPSDLINPKTNDRPSLRNYGDTDNESDGQDDDDLVEKISEHSFVDSDFE
ncbi:Uncharacterized protein Fot_37632 [Forsythia ovata]|uniref:Uncharacterized protein n=1 Tax=Forsythia ovata TaxID=205694 RepID=A0ABD1RZK3_9LAMI